MRHLCIRRTDSSFAGGSSTSKKKSKNEKPRPAKKEKKVKSLIFLLKSLDFVLKMLDFEGEKGEKEEERQQEATGWRSNIYCWPGRALPDGWAIVLDSYSIFPPFFYTFPPIYSTCPTLLPHFTPPFSTLPPCPPPPVCLLCLPDSISLRFSGAGESPEQLSASAVRF